jgi:hypothetical protein
MAPSSITIKIDFGAEGGGSASSISLNGGVPTPMSLGASAAAATGQFESVLPTPFDNKAQMVGQIDSGAPPPPSPTFIPGEGGGSASSGLGPTADIPTPFSAGGFAQTSAGQAGDAVPTPFDSTQGYSVAGEQAPTPHAGGEVPADQTAPAPPQPQEKAEKKGTR